MKCKKCIVLLIMIASLIANFVHAGRFGGGRSFGMRRSFSSPSYSRPQYTHTMPQSNPNVAQPTQRSGGIGAGTAAVLGAAAGAAGGYMLGRNSNENNQNNGNNANNSMNNASAPNSNSPQSQENNATTNSLNSSNIPWGIITILGILLVLGLMVFKKSKPGGLGTSQNNNNNNSPFINTTNPGFNNMNTNSINNNMINMDKLPDGIEKVYFLRQAKGIFLHVQSMNNRENLFEIQKYLTPELYQSIQATIQDNDAIADFNNLDCQLLDCNVEGNQLFASVKFTGFVSENPQQSPVPFGETWNFVKTDINSGKWLVEGIQQD